MPQIEQPETEQANALFEALREAAPSIAFCTSRDLDPYSSWNGDGPDPRDDGYSPYDVTVKAVAIIGGLIHEGAAYLGGSYYKPAEDLGMIHGYLPQLLEEAAEELDAPAGSPLAAEQAKALEVLRAYMRAE